MHPQRMDEKEFIKIIEKYLSGEATEGETRLVDSYLKLLEENAGGNLKFEDRELLKEEIKSALWCKIELNEQDSKIRKGNRIKQWSVAASLIFLLSFFGYSLFQDRETVPLSDTIVHSYDVEPGSDKAQLVLNDGQVIDLDKLEPSVLSNQENGWVSKVKEGVLEYSNRENLGDKESINTNTLITPKGGRYSVVLSDGSRVWLNANSSITFPLVFSGKERRVKLKGEAYFEISENKAKPFIVSSGEIEVEVLGTHFNLMNYDNESISQTTLLGGAVRITDKDKSIVLNPMQQASHSNALGFSVSNVKDNQAIAWKSGYFHFDEESLESVMRKISRWYNVDIEYQDRLNELKFGGKVSSNKPLSAILEMISLTANVHFKLEERKVLIMK